VDRRGWIKLFDVSVEEWSARRASGESLLVGQYPIPPPSEEEMGAPTRRRAFTFIHSTRGIARHENKLMILVEELGEEAGDVLRWSDIQHKVYVVDLESERLESVTPIELPGMGILKGVLPDGVLVIRTLVPEPGIYAFRIFAGN